MKRPKDRGTSRQPYLPENEPDFYAMPFFPPMGWDNVCVSNANMISTKLGGGVNTLGTVLNKRETMTVVSSESTNGDVSTSNNSVASFEEQQDDAADDDPPTIPFDLYKLASAPTSSMGVPGLMAPRIARPAPAIIWSGNPTKGADDVARSAQMLFEEVKGGYQIPGQEALSKQSCLDEGALILGTLNAVAPYYDFTTNPHLFY